MKRRKKVLATLLSLALMGMYMPLVYSEKIIETEFVSDEVVECGFDRIYRDTPGSTWIMEKPASPEEGILNVSFDAKLDEEYTFTLMDSFMETEIATINGVSEETGESSLQLPIPGTTPNGSYKLVGKVGNNTETVKEVIVDTNIALEAKVSSNLVNNMSSNLNDLTIANYLLGGASGSASDVVLDPPVEITYEFAKKNSISKLQIFSGNVDEHGPVEIEVYYKDNTEYKKIEKKFTNLEWNSYVGKPGENVDVGASRKYSILELGESVSTTSLMIKILKSNHSQWGNKLSIDEIMVWGHRTADENEVADDYDISLGQAIGTANKENLITVTGKATGQFMNIPVKITLMSGEEILVEKDAQFQEGVLFAELKTLEDIQPGTYTVKVTSEEGIDKTFNYVVKGELTYEKNIKDKLSPYTPSYTEFKSIDEVMDNDYETSYTGAAIKLWTTNMETDEQFVVRNVKIYADKESFNSVELGVGIAQNTNEKFTKALEFKNLEWFEDEHGSYVELYTNYNFLAYGYELRFDRPATIKEIDVDGIYFDENIFESSEVKYNGQVINGIPLFDNSNLTRVEFGDNNGKGNQEIEISSNDGTMYSFDKLFISSNYPSKQGIKQIKVSYWQNEKWIETDAKISSSYKNDEDNKKEMMVIDVPHIQSAKIKLDVDFEAYWGHGVIFELNALGTKEYKAEAVAALVDKTDKLTAGSTKVTFNYLDKVVKNWNDNFELNIISSSSMDVVGLDGTVRHSSQDTTSIIEVEVTDKKTGEKFLSKAIEVEVPKALSGNKVQADIQIDELTAYHNPAMGWVAYVEGFECAVHTRYEDGTDTAITNWNARNKGLCVEIGTDAVSAREYTRQMDELISAGMPCDILYIREPWSWFEPIEGQYAWENEESACYELVNWAKKNNIQLAFRIITNSSACAQQATPQWVFESGAEVATRKNYDYVSSNEPFLDDMVFVEKYYNFIKALSDRFDNEDTAFIDAHGHGHWGEMDGNMWSKGNMNDTVARLQKAFEDNFENVLLGGQLMSNQGRDTIMKSFEIDGPNFVMRRDAYGSNAYLDGHKPIIKKYRDQGIPMFAENCFHHFDSRNFRWSNNIAYSEGRVHPYGDNNFYTMKDMMDRVVSDAIVTGANSLDLRTLEDCKLWMENGKDKLDRWAREGGYRISIRDAVYTKALKAGEELSVNSSWINNGVGILPNNNKRWNKKMKVAYALIDKDEKIVQKQIVSTDDINAGEFEKGNTYEYETTFKVADNLSKGNYRLAVSILNEKDDYNVGVQLANKGEITNEGWLTLGEVQVTDKYSNVTMNIIGEGIVEFDKDLVIGKAATMTVTPKEGYEVHTVEIDGRLVKLDEKNQYIFESLSENIHIKVKFNEIAPKKPEFIVEIHGEGEVDFIEEAVIGQRATLKFSPNKGYQTGYVRINEEEVELVNNEYIFESLPEKIEVYVEYEAVQDQSEKVKANIKIIGEGTVTFDKELVIGQSATMIVIPKDQYKVELVKINGEAVELKERKILISDLPEELNIEVIFVKELIDTPKVNVSINIKGEGTVTFDKDLVVGQTATITLIAKKGYEVKSVTVNGEDVQLTENSYVIENLPKDLEIDVEFVKTTDSDVTANTNTSTTKVSDSTKGTSKKILPQAGEQRSSLKILVGIAISMIVSFVYVAKSKRKKI